MKFKFPLLSIFCFCLLGLTAGKVYAKDEGLRYILQKGAVRCGTDLSSKLLAWQDDTEEKNWHGFDVSICRAFSTAFFGHHRLIEMIDVPADKVDEALNTGKIDIMLGQFPLTASTEVSIGSSEAGLLYYDRQMFAVKKIEDATSMAAYKGQKVCVVTGSDDADNVQTYSARNSLDFKFLFFKNPDDAKRAFLLSRCEVFSGSEIYLRGLMKNFLDDKRFVLIPEVIALKPARLFVKSDNNQLRILSKWIINALVLAEGRGITAKTLPMFASDTGTSVRNLLGIDEKLWRKFGLKPDWVAKFIADYGNYGDIYERNLGSESELNIKRDENKLLEDGGLIRYNPFT